MHNLPGIFSDSEVTLVPRDRITLTLSRDIPTDTVLVASDGLGYIVETKSIGRSITTTYSRSNGEIVAALEWRDRFSDRIVIGDEPKTKLSKRFRKPSLLSSSYIFTGADGKKYKWKGIGCGIQAQLFVIGEKEALCTFDPARALHSRLATLRIEPRAVPMMDFIVVSFLALEKNSRAKEKTPASLALDIIGRAGGMGALYYY
ncbi:hypothetical protein BOTBODRAFT_25585 [Botryobasidium botryosum FD-172 SS1]|uniref:DUF6593 domain-containing protein n=1 Tax=Botryobasidium botryosum (strain FD-172 SS1) TaxID=930990 RepID=A0A067MZI1_BOTB1|nr:hypothetical protein BOTBODRAFT_25585 [Botryobasidium botryosum FD-172 SS1]